ncbi:MAG: hypothetical protein Q4B50_02280 [Bacillota bacterium]|nr:hypothetical protein [Bacillota bacterium]
MDKFVQELTNNPEFKKAFIEYLHGQEARFGESFKVIADNLNKQVMDSIKAFAEEKGMSLQDNEEVQKKVVAQCNTIADQLNKAIIEQFSKGFDA